MQFFLLKKSIYVAFCFAIKITTQKDLDFITKSVVIAKKEKVNPTCTSTLLAPTSTPNIASPFKRTGELITCDATGVTYPPTP